MHKTNIRWREHRWQSDPAEYADADTAAKWPGCHRRYSEARMPDVRWSCVCDCHKTGRGFSRQLSAETDAACTRIYRRLLIEGRPQGASWRHGSVCSPCPFLSLRSATHSQTHRKLRAGPGNLLAAQLARVQAGQHTETIAPCAQTVLFFQSQPRASHVMWCGHRKRLRLPALGLGLAYHLQQSASFNI